MMPSTWLVISVLLALLSLGITGVVKLLFCLLVLLCGCFIVVYSVATSDDTEASSSEFKRCRQKWERPTTSQFRPQPVPTGDRILTGAPLIDEQLHQILSYVFRDFIHSWQGALSHTNEFSHRLKEVSEIAIAALAEKIRSVDWVTFLTTRLVNDVASHVRLFKKARLLLKTRNRDISEAGKLADLESMFFDAEVSVESTLCRDLVCTIHQEEISYLQDLAEIMLFLLMPKEDFSAQSLRTLTRELLVNVVLKPVLDLISDPDFINQNIVWLYRDYPIKPDVLSLTIRHSECLEELQATRESVSKEISILRSNDSRSEMDSSLKQQLNSLLYLRKTIDGRIHRLQSGSDSDSLGLPAQVDWNQMIGPGLKLFVLPIDVILKNNLALSYFIDYMTSIGCQAYIFFFLNIEGWKVSSEQQIQAIELAEAYQQGLESSKEGFDQVRFQIHKDTSMENMREAAYSIYEEYLSEKANPRLKIDDTSVKRLLFKIRTEPPDSEWFSEVQQSVFDKLQADERFLESFKRSMGYVKLLAELDLLKDPIKSEDDDCQSLGGDDFSIYDTLSLNSNDEVDCSVGKAEDDKDHGKSSPDLDSTIMPVKDSDSGLGESVRSHKRIGSDSYLPILKTHHRNASHGNLIAQADPPPLQQQPPQLHVPILTADVVSYQCVKSSGKSYALYKLMVKSRNRRGIEERRAVFRRYSDFYALHDKVSSKSSILAKLPFPKKKTFGNLDTQLLEQRLKMLHDYLQELLRTEVLEQNPGLLELLQKFLDQSSYEVERSQSSNVAKAVGSVRNSVKTVSNAVTSVPGQLINTVDNVMDGITKVLQTKPSENNLCDSKVGLETDSAQDNIPLRIALLFVDEVFDLGERNQWLRRQIVAMLRQILKAMFGDWANRRIVDYFSQLTSPSTLSAYLLSLKESLWPNGYPAAPQAPRDENAKMRTRVAAKMALFSSLSEELKRIIGSETSRAGLLMLFDMLQHPVLNKRLSVVLLEAMLDTIFLGQDFPAIFVKLHSRSPRVKNELKNSHRKKVDLRR